MLKCFWVVVFAIGLTLSARAQNAERVPEDGPFVEESQPSQAQGRIGNGISSPLAVVIVETPEQATHAQKSEQDAAIHEAADLAAQEKAADAADRSAATAEGQAVPTLVLAILGAVIAVIALVYSILSNRRSDYIARAQLRAYVTVKAFHVYDCSEGKVPYCVCAVTNSGQTPALDLTFYTRTVFGPVGIEPPEMPKVEKFSQSIVGPGLDSFSSTRLNNAMSAGNMTSIKDGSAFIGVRGAVAYRDIFGQQHTCEFYGVFGGKHGTNAGGDMYSQYEHST